MEKDKNKHHLASWNKMSFPFNEGGIGFRSIQDICKSMEYKQWCNFRYKPSLWSEFLMDKYCKRSHPISKKCDTGQSQAWKSLMTNKKDAEQHIQLRLHSGDARFWWDSWLGMGPLASHSTGGGRPGKIAVS
ncbi:uncharacterized protein [Nicotiana tomentosiformis]|uniref:uncharacterized protein n=1 Tax=Nicotiana tomentosiformis TaxID=4098 RepID=UPI00388CB7A4